MDLTFDFTADVTPTSPPDFRGPVVQGPRGQRFVYIDIGTSAGQHDSPWTRRLKIPLNEISATMVERAIKSGRALETRVPGTGKDGTPTCATVKPFEGWMLAT